MNTVSFYEQFSISKIQPQQMTGFIRVAINDLFHALHESLNVRVTHPSCDTTSSPSTSAALPSLGRVIVEPDNTCERTLTEEQLREASEEEVLCSKEQCTGLYIATTPKNGQYRVLYPYLGNYGKQVGALIRKNKYTNQYSSASIHDLVEAIRKSSKGEKMDYAIQVLFYSGVSTDIMNEINEMLLRKLRRPRNQ